MSESHVEDNAVERRRLVQLTEGWTDAELARELGKGWSVATKLLHLAFWDQYAAALIRKWKRDGLTESPFDTDALNEAIRVLSRAVAPQAVVALARSAADEVDREVEEVAPELRAAIEKKGRSRALCRSVHRRAHLDQIESALRE
jgi:hypothetical protein